MVDGPPTPLRPVPDEPSPAKPRVKKRRLLLLLVPVAFLALISTAFGMMMAVAADLPNLENEPQYRGQGGKNSVLNDHRGRRLGVLTSNTNRIFVKDDDVSEFMRAAIISVEDERFNQNNGVDLKAIGRAFVNDVIKRGARQGGSTITQQFVKNALRAQDQRTVFQKMREAALAYHLTREWGKPKILREYLNSIYFGNGAYGVEAAARAYFGEEFDHRGCGTIKRPCAKELEPHEAALLAGVVANPSAYDPVANPARSKRRRDLVLGKMLEQEFLTPEQHAQAVGEALPPPEGIELPKVESRAPYFTTWVRQQLVDRYGARRAFEGGLTIRTTLDLDLQKKAQDAVDGMLANPAGPTAALVAIDNGTGEVRAMVGGRDYEEAPFNLATQGQRQPGSAFKPFTLAAALREGIGPGSVWPSRKRQFCVTRTKSGGCSEAFEVNNFEGSYAGQRTLANALTFSDNAVYAAAGIEVGTKKVARLAERMGIRSKVSTNLAMTLGGLRQGVTPLDMAHAYETFQQRGKRITGVLGASEDGPVGLREVVGKDKTTVIDRNRKQAKRVLPAGVAQTATQVMGTVVAQGTGRRAALGGGIFAAGKTGTTENSGDAWFVGFTDRLTVAVWVGYPDKLTPMETEFQGGPVEGGTFPALIWRSFMVGANAVLDARVDAERKDKGLPPLDAATTATPVPTPSTPVVPDAAPVPAPTTTPVPAPTPEPEPEPGADAHAGSAPDPHPTPAPTPTPPAGGGTGGAGGVAAP